MARYSGRNFDKDTAELDRAIAQGVRPNGHDGESFSAPWPAPLDMAALATRDPEPPRFIVGDWLPCGYATLLAGHGGVGKSGVGLGLGVCIAHPDLAQWYGLPVQTRRVLYLSCEDRASILHWRLARTCAHLGVGMGELAGKLDVLDLVGKDALLWTQNTLLRHEPAPGYVTLRDRLRGEKGVLLVVDGVTDTYAGNENDRAQVKAYVNALLDLIDPHDGALLLLGHVNRQVAGNGGETSEGYSGSTGWHNAVRARWYLYPETRANDEDKQRERTGELLLDLQKSNLGPAEQSMRFRWDSDGHLFTGQVVVGRGPGDSKRRDARERDAILEAIQAVVDSGDHVPTADRGPRNALGVLSQRAEFPDSIRPASKGDRRRFWRHIEALRQNREIHESSKRRANRHLVATFVPGPAPEASDYTAEEERVFASFSE